MNRNCENGFEVGRCVSVFKHGLSLLGVGSNVLAHYTYEWCRLCYQRPLMLLGLHTGGNRYSSCSLPLHAHPTIGWSVTWTSAERRRTTVWWRSLSSISWRASRRMLPTPWSKHHTFLLSRDLGPRIACQMHLLRWEVRRILFWSPCVCPQLASFWSHPGRSVLLVSVYDQIFRCSTLRHNIHATAINRLERIL